MPRMSKRDKVELEFFLNGQGRITFNELCRKCERDCKQSFRAIIVSCPEYNSKEVCEWQHRSRTCPARE